jgi:hypothetical protein
MKNRNTIQEELDKLNSGLDPDSNGKIYSVPEGYFEGLAASVLAKIKGETTVSSQEEIAQLSPLLAGISHSMPYFVPQDYFQSNIEGLKAFTSESEESLVLSFVDKQMPYEVPRGYFANFPEQVLEQVTVQKGAKIVPFAKRKWVRLAAAAMVAGIITLSGIVYFTNRGSRATTDPVAAELKKASTKELNDFIKSTAVDVTDSKAPVTAKNRPSKTESQKLFDDVSDKELDAFLNQMPTDAEVDIN